MNNMSYKTKKAMTKDEVSLLLDLVQNRPIITSKETNAASNKQKDEAWSSLTNDFNSKNGYMRRNKEQLKAKWDNLKKAARKRCQQIRQNNLRTDSEEPDFIPPDDILERVADLLRSTCTAFEVPFGGDGVGLNENIVLLDGFGIRDDVTSPTLKPTTDELLKFTTPEPKSTVLPISEAQKRKVDEAKPRCLCGKTNMSKELQTNTGKKKKTDADIRRERNLAITRYYSAKTIKINLEIELLKAEIAKKTNQDQASTSDTTD